jgi:hypothetical protein
VRHGDPLGDVQHGGDGLIWQHAQRQVAQRLVYKFVNQFLSNGISFFRYRYWYVSSKEK